MDVPPPLEPGYLHLQLGVLRLQLSVLRLQLGVRRPQLSVFRLQWLGRPLLLKPDHFSTMPSYVHLTLIQLPLQTIKLRSLILHTPERDIKWHLCPGRDRSRNERCWERGGGRNRLRLGLSRGRIHNRKLHAPGLQVEGKQRGWRGGKRAIGGGLGQGRNSHRTREGSR